jgi:uncharacterized membrane protein
VLVQPGPDNLVNKRRERHSFGEDFRRFFVRGLAALLPTLITLWLLVKVWNFLWDVLGQHIIWGIKQFWQTLVDWKLLPFQPPAYIDWFWSRHMPEWAVRLIGVTLAVVAVYIVGVFVGNFIGRAFWRIAEHLVMKIPFIRAIYPAVKQVTEFVLTDRKSQFESSSVVAVQPHEKGIWSIGLVTGPGLKPLTDSVGQEMVNVFVPSTPTAFSGYMLVVPRSSVVELPLTVEEAMRLLVSGGVITPKDIPANEGKTVEIPAVPDTNASVRGLPQT